MFAFYRTYLTSNTESLELVFICLFFKGLEKGVVFQAKKLEKHIPEVPKSWKTVSEISGNHASVWSHNRGGEGVQAGES